MSPQAWQRAPTACCMLLIPTGSFAKYPRTAESPHWRAAGKIAPRSRPRWIDVYHPLAHAAFRGLDYGVDSAAWRASVEARAA